MPEYFNYAIGAYLILISIVACAMTIIDKICAIKNQRRISERALIIAAFLGGAISEYITMQLIRHKTQHKKFMIGLPAIFLAQLTAAVFFGKAFL